VLRCASSTQPGSTSLEANEIDRRSIQQANVLMVKQSFIDIRRLEKVYRTPGGDLPALKGIDVQVNRGEFVAVIGKSGSGKSTFINMLAGIDRPTAGEIWIGGTAVHTLSENALAEWRGRNLGIVFQFFQLLPILTLIENVMMPMDLNGLFHARERPERAMQLLSRMGLADHARKLPAAVSGGQQQRAAIARALATDPPLIVADEPTGNLDSKTAEQIFDLFKELAAGGKTILMVTHDDDLAKRADRTIVVADGEVVNEYLVRALSEISQDQLVEVKRRARLVAYPPGATIVRQGEEGKEFFIIVEGAVEVWLEHPGGKQLQVDRLREGQYFGEMALVGNGLRRATVRAVADTGASLAVLNAADFAELVGASRGLREELAHIMDIRLVRNQVQSLSTMPPEALLEFTKALQVRTYPPGANIVQQGAIGNTFFIILDGEAEVIVRQSNGAEVVLDLLTSGQYFGEMALLGSGRRTATVRSSLTQPLKAVELDRTAFDHMFAESEAFKSQVSELSRERQATVDGLVE
jgi:ABC-type lipoprotein export system ATPase subunit/CRP-like cAMP-binding protein